VALLVCLAGLVPQSEEALSIELVVAGIAGGAIGARAIHRRPVEDGPTRAQIRGQTVLMALPSIAVVIGAATLWSDWGGGLYWVVAGLVLFLLNGIMNAWVLLVEIQRQTADLTGAGVPGERHGRPVAAEASRGPGRGDPTHTPVWHRGRGR
jgi:hypothetical protein